MNNPSFSGMLKDLGYTKAAFARLLEVSPETVTRWGDDPPTVVMLYLKLRLRDARIADVLAGP